MLGHNKLAGIAERPKTSDFGASKDKITPHLDSMDTFVPRKRQSMSKKTLAGSSDKKAGMPASAKNSMDRRVYAKDLVAQSEDHLDGDAVIVEVANVTLDQFQGKNQPFNLSFND